jgi:hypothetical protein
MAPIPANRPSLSAWIRAFLLLLLAGGCASHRSDMQSAFQGEQGRNPNPDPVSVVFVFSHVRQTVGLDAVPKLVPPSRNVTGFDEILGDALAELSNLGPYATFTEEAGDVNRPERRAVRDSLMRSHDITVKVRLEAKRRFAPFYLGVLASTATGTLLPVPYRQTFTLRVEVLDPRRHLLATTSREAAVTTWVEALLLPAYPFLPVERMREEVYVEFLHDAFRELESRGVLRKDG